MKQLPVFFVLAATFYVPRVDAQTSVAITGRAAARFLDQAAWGPRRLRLRSCSRRESPAGSRRNSP